MRGCPDLKKRLALCLAAWLSGCSPTGLQQPCSRRLNSVTAPAPAVVFAGQPAQIDMTLPLIVDCPTGSPQATGVTSEVVDGANQPVDSTSSAPSTSSLSGYDSTISFVPDGGGVYAVTTTFEPSLGSTQRQVQVVRDRSLEGSLATRSGCLSFARLGSALICQRATELEVLREGQPVQVLPATESLTAGPVLWAWSAGTITRLVDPGQGPLQATGSAPFPGAGAGVRSASQTKVSAILSGDGQVGYQELLAADGGLVARALSLPAAPPSASTGLLLVDEGTIAYGTGAATLCVVTLEPLAARCRPTALTIGPSEGDVLWARGSSTDDPSVAYVRVVGGEPSATFLTARAPSLLVDTRGARPAFRFADHLVVPKLPELVLEAWAWDGRGEAGLGPGVVWFIDAGGTGTVYAR